MKHAEEDANGTVTLRCCKGVAATVTTDGPTTLRFCKGCGVLHDCSICDAALAIQQRAMTNTKQLKTLNFPKDTCGRRKNGPARPLPRPRPLPAGPGFGPGPAPVRPRPRPRPCPDPAPPRPRPRPRPRARSGPGPGGSRPRRPPPCPSPGGIPAMTMTTMACGRRRCHPFAARLLSPSSARASVPTRFRRGPDGPRDSAGSPRPVKNASSRFRRGLPTAQFIAPKCGAGIWAPAP